MLRIINAAALTSGRLLEPSVVRSKSSRTDLPCWLMQLGHHRPLLKRACSRVVVVEAGDGVGDEFDECVLAGEHCLFCRREFVVAVPGDGHR